MGLKPDHWIRRMALEQGMIEPFVEGQVREGVISYGLSSYGYDLRVADEFKVFTDVYGAIVDPKGFAPNSFVDFKTDVCVVPPNSFALARSVEYFRIPRNVLTICLGKSTYARCFRGDTRVALVDGTAPTLEEMARRADDGDVFWGYSVGPFGRIIVTLLEAPRFIGRDALLEVTLDDGAIIHCTPDHEFLMRDGTILMAHELRPDMGLKSMSRRRSQEHDFERVSALTLNPSPTRRAPMTALRYTVSATGARDFAVDSLAYADSSSPTAKARRLQVIKHTEGAAHTQWLISAPLAGLNRCSRPVLTVGARPGKSAPAQYRNHQVQSVRALSGDHDVYCLTVPEAGNFALEAGVFVRNCGLIVNVTPFEPGWEGFVTLEISNTTPMPAKVYANEGLCQVLFFEGDEPCEITYADRKGKYQGQTGVTPPRL